MRAEAQKHEIEIMIKLALPFVIRLDKGIYRVKLNNDECAIHLCHQNITIGESRGKESSFAQKASTGELTEVQNMNIPGALTQYSMMVIQFLRLVSNFSDNKEQIHEYEAERAYKYLNHFIDTYRFVTGDIEVRPLTHEQFYDTRAGQSLHFEVNCRSTGELTMGSLFGKRGISTLSKPFDTETQNRVKNMLKIGTQPPIVELLLLNARSYLEAGEFRLAIVELGSALDIYVEQIARDMLRQRGELSDEIENKLGHLKTKQIVESIVKNIIVQDIINSNEWMVIDNNFRILRNHVIHDAYQPKRDEVVDAIEVIKSFHEWLAKVTLRS